VRSDTFQARSRALSRSRANVQRVERREGDDREIGRRRDRRRHGFSLERPNAPKARFTKVNLPAGDLRIARSEGSVFGAPRGGATQVGTTRANADRGTLPRAEKDRGLVRVCPCVYTVWQKSVVLVSASGSAPSFGTWGHGRRLATRELLERTKSEHEPAAAKGSHGSSKGAYLRTDRDSKRGEDRKVLIPSVRSGVRIDTGGRRFGSRERMERHGLVRGSDLGGPRKGRVRLRGRSDWHGGRDRDVKRRSDHSRGVQANTLLALGWSRRSGFVGVNRRAPRKDFDLDAARKRSREREIWNRMRIRRSSELREHGCS